MLSCVANGNYERVSAGTVRICIKRSLLAPRVAFLELFIFISVTVLLFILYYTETLWKHTSSKPYIQDEQILINTVLVEMDTVWEKRTSVQELCTVREGWEGRGDNDIHIYVFPAQVSCRSGCCKPSMPRDSLYCTHPYAASKWVDMRPKEVVLKELQAWFLPQETEV